MNDLSLKPKQPERQKDSSSGSVKRGAFFFVLGIALVSILAFFLMAVRNCANKKLINDMKASMKDTVRTVVKIDTVYVPGKVVESNFEGCYDVSDCNTVLVTVKNGIVEVSDND